MLERWKPDQSAMLSIANECRKTKDTSSLLSLYSQDISTNTIAMFERCKFKQVSQPQGNMNQLIHVARDLKKNQVLFVTNQHKTEEGWWIWKEPILEEKGFIYVSKEDQAPINSEYQPKEISKETLIKEGLDQYAGNYRLTKIPYKIDSCEVWMFRPIAPKWYLFYHQNRECQFRGL
jgi:hypothetical protein